ncbi:MAG: RT0821/Lpp0805 family surface protein [Rhizobiaceae bacterium]
MRPAQVAKPYSTRNPLRFRAGFVALFAALVWLSGCASGGIDMLGVGTDNKVKTGSIAADGSAPAASEAWSDEMTIRNAVSSANLAELGDSPLAWANADTGSQGAVTQITEIDVEGIRCRKFIASRESFEGVSLYAGEACLQGNGIWQMRKFGPAEG